MISADDEFCESPIYLPHVFLLIRGISFLKDLVTESSYEIK
jgi:hypothetical protein